MWQASCVLNTALRVRKSKDWTSFQDYRERARIACRKITGADPMLITLAIQAAW
jgi:hypothetical protein